MEAVPSNSGGHPRPPNTPTLWEVDRMPAPLFRALQATISSWGPGETPLALLRVSGRERGLCAGTFLQGFGWIRWGWAGILSCDKNVTHTTLGPNFQGNLGAVETCSKEQRLWYLFLLGICFENITMCSAGKIDL